MDENYVLDRFRRQKIATIKQLVDWFHCSVMTVRRRLRKWRSFTSINENGSYYTLPQIPIFDPDGLWRYQGVLFSSHGNLRQTIVSLVANSDKGLSAVEIAKLVDLPPNSSFISRMKDVSGVKREKHRGRFVYFSDKPAIYRLQKYTLVTGARGGKAAGVVTDQEAVMILVELIKHPGINIEQLAVLVSKQGRWVEPAAVRAFLELHNLVKKTADTAQ